MMTTLIFTGGQYARLRDHLITADGKEGAAIALCGRRSGARRHRLVVRAASCSTRNLLPPRA